MHAFYLNTSFIYYQESCQYLANKLLNWRNDQDIILYAQEKYHERCCEKVLKFRSNLEPKCNKTCENKSCENPKATQRRDRRMMDFSFIRYIKQFFPLGNRY